MAEEHPPDEESEERDEDVLHGSWPQEGGVKKVEGEEERVSRLFGGEDVVAGEGCDVLDPCCEGEE